MFAIIKCVAEEVEGQLVIVEERAIGHRYATQDAAQVVCDQLNDDAPDFVFEVFDVVYVVREDHSQEA